MPGGHVPAAGGLVTPIVFPAPPVVYVVTQGWVADPAAPLGFSWTNTVVLDRP